MSIMDAPRCTAHKRDGSLCRQAAVRHRTKCRLHGGKTLVGAASGQYRHGRYSKVLPVRLAAKYHEALHNPQLLSVRDDIAACESRLADLFSRVDSGESGATWEALGTAHRAFEGAMAGGDTAAMGTALATMRSLIQAGRADYEAWADIHQTWETRCKLTMTETKTLVAMQHMISAQQLDVYLGVLTDALQNAITKHADAITARAILGDVTTELRTLVALENGRPLGPLAG